MAVCDHPVSAVLDNISGKYFLPETDGSNTLLPSLTWYTTMTALSGCDVDQTNNAQKMLNNIL